jgi:hypothetical protein
MAEHWPSVVAMIVAIDKKNNAHFVFLMVLQNRADEFVFMFASF